MKKLIVTVCWGNILRSVFLKLRLEDEFAKRSLTEQYEVVSRGIMGSGGVSATRHANIKGYPTAWAHSEPHLCRLGIVISDTQVSTPVDRHTIERASIVLAPDQKVLRTHPASLMSQFPDMSRKMFLFSELTGETGDIDDCHEEDTTENFGNLIVKVDRVSREGIGRLIELLMGRGSSTTH